MGKKAAEEAGLAFKKLMKALGWLIPIAALIVAVVFLIKGRPNPTFSEKPELLMPKYMEIVLKFLPPSTELPTQSDFDQLMSFFSSKERDWVKENLNALAWLGMSQNEQAYNDADAQKKMQAAFKFIISQGPIQPLTIRGTVFDESKEHVTINAASIRQTYQIVLESQGGRWRIVDLWGIPSKFATQISQFNAKHGSS